MSGTSIHCDVRSANQNAHAFRDRPSQIRVTHRPHPLFGRTLPVIQRRREASEAYWIVQLPDGSRIRLPSRWTDHPIGTVPPAARRSGRRATPDALRALADLLGCLCAASISSNARSSHQGGVHERATPAVRSAQIDLGRETLAKDRRPDPRHTDLDPRADGQIVADRQRPAAGGAGAQR
ncbi:MAG: hypothetical protein IID28_14710 [Planctomycetes bacterium]|nr:hypothetical protein [Planctomycetota bacterium]